MGLARAASHGAHQEELARLAHWLAGAAGTVGYDAFTEPAREMEAAAKAGDAALAGEVLQRLLRMADQLEVPEVAIG
jgi:HPt (histidine-containing phosphotransfer) domain-containing protein